MIQEVGFVKIDKKKKKTFILNYKIIWQTNSVGDKESKQSVLIAFGSDRKYTKLFFWFHLLLLTDFTATLSLTFSYFSFYGDSEKKVLMIKHSILKCFT